MFAQTIGKRSGVELGLSGYIRIHLLNNAQRPDTERKSLPALKDRKGGKLSEKIREHK